MQTSNSAVSRHTVVVRDLRAETEALLDIISDLRPDDWLAPTPSVGWSVQDQVHHLAYFDQATVLAATDPATFRREADRLITTGGDFPDQLVQKQRHLSPERTLAWFAEARSALLAVVARAAPGSRLPWYGPDMSITSAATARLMETWAHGQDVADALRAAIPPTDRLRHIAHLGVATRSFSFAIRGLPSPDDDVAVELSAPSGEVWRWGASDAAQRVTGSALDFCLVVTQRRHLSDTDLVMEGRSAADWMSLAQAYAGVPGSGRDPLTRHDTQGEL